MAGAGLMRSVGWRGLGWVLERWPWPKGGISAITFGDLILGRTAGELDRCRCMSRCMRQAYPVGPLFAGDGGEAGWWKVMLIGELLEVEAYRVSGRIMRLSDRVTGSLKKG